MIQLEIDKGTKFRGKSIYLYLSHSPTERMKQEKNLEYIPMYKKEKQYWEIPSTFFYNVLNALDDWDIEIIGKIPHDIQKALYLDDKMNTKAQKFEFKTKPFKHQEETLDYSKKHNKFIIGDEQGLGKTKQAIDIAISKKGKFKYCLIVCCVNGLKWNWVGEIKTHSWENAHILGQSVNSIGNVVIESVENRIKDLETKHNEFFLITNIETLRDENFCKKVKELCQDGIIGMTIIDEIHMCKNPTSQQSKGILSLNSYYKLALTGTPLMNAPEDLFIILKWLDVEHNSYTAFSNHFCRFGGFGGYSVIGYKNLDELQDKLFRVMIRRLKKDVLDLPDKIESYISLDMNTQQAKLYQDVKQLILKDIDRIKLSKHPLTELIRLRQCTGYPQILSSKKIKSVKFEKTLELVENAIKNNDKVVIYSNWTKVINPLFEFLKNFNPALVTGEIDNPQDEIDKFRTNPDCKIILGTIPALGTGYTLTEAQTVIFLDEPWNKSIKNQAIDRTHRIGTKGVVNCYTLLCKNTIDEKIAKLVKEKGKISDAIVDNIDIDLINNLIN